MENLHCRSLSSIHIHYNQARVGGLSMSPDPARRIVNLQLTGGSRILEKLVLGTRTVRVDTE